MSDRVWPAKVCWRTTMNQPIADAVTATTVPAISAFVMKWNWNSWSMCMTRVVDRGRLGRANHHQAAVRALEHLDRSGVEGAQGLRGDHLARRAVHGRAAGEVDDAVEVGERSEEH